MLAQVCAVLCCRVHGRARIAAAVGVGVPQAASAAASFISVARVDQVKQSPSSARPDRAFDVAMSPPRVIAARARAAVGLWGKNTNARKAQKGGDARDRARVRVVKTGRGVAAAAHSSAARATQAGRERARVFAARAAAGGKGWGRGAIKRRSSGG